MSAGPSQHLQIGYVARAHGLRGEVAIRTFDPASEALFDVDRVLVRRRDGQQAQLTVEHVRNANKELLTTFAEVSTREDAAGLVGATVFVFREDLEPPSEGEYFQGDLVGLRAFDEAGAEVGVVEEIWSHGEVPTLVIRGGGQEHLLPFVDQFVPDVDLPNRKVVVRLPEISD